MASDLSANVPNILYGEGDRITLLKRLLKELGQPDQAFKIIHIAGTNGKGSTSTMISALLKLHYDRIGLFTSPHLYTERESIVVNHEMIASTTFYSCLEQVYQAALTMGLQPEEDLSQFETTFLVAMVYFANRVCDYVVIECGLGGALDATNAIGDSEYAIVTKIGLDHLNLLGDNLEAIAHTKAGIIRPQRTVVLAPFQREGVETIIRNKTESQASTFIRVEEDFIMKDESGTYYINDPAYKDFSIQLGLKGTYQQENLATVMAWYLTWLKQNNRTFQITNINKALENLSLPGRFEWIQNDPAIILDAAHNVDAIEEFITSLKEEFGQQKVTLICGFLKDKDVPRIVERLVTLNADFILTQVDHPDRYMPIEQLQALFEAYAVPFQTHVEPREALEQSLKDQQTPLLIVGSFYLIKVVRSDLLGKA
ncbi:bifunctional folylpolyglutamate synthase/dihydrofolate synthase [Facklamia sp. DSM 111018]|uniref:tetrahydrofolate synthase n=1 Tax=Facklamia lactis TaxID=2749967 RepID=A0ABS0LN02_9LACT|nr:Mur ligase family protein [Facklamia lactis]MBG9979785.1 bifunctional folylpolyglutamate synthase/dihydrofolate synthase [Facklamia lactis]MBG9985535.1 bifunctional folylpolyglutamate synthase/dihydrofolate synthase [Facklamia lactis]